MSDADEILKLKKLLDAGVITQEEFEREKKMIFDTSRERREAVTAYTRAASARRGTEEKRPEHSAGDETNRALYSAIANAAGVMGADHSATKFHSDNADTGSDAEDTAKERCTVSGQRERAADTEGAGGKSRKSVRDGAETAQSSGRKEGRSSSGVRIRAVLFAIFLWPVGFIYVLRKKPFRKGKNIALAVTDGILSVLLIVGVTLGLLLYHYRAQLNALHEAAEAAAGGAASGADTISSAAQKIASDAVSGGVI